MIKASAFQFLGLSLLCACTCTALTMCRQTRERIVSTRVRPIRGKFSDFRANIKTSSEGSIFSLQDKYYGDGEERSAFPLKVLLIGAVGVFGVFGTGFITSFQSAVKEIAAPETAIVGKTLKKGSEEEGRGAMTRLTRREINAKLAQVPVFYLSEDGSSVYTKDKSEGLFFMDKSDADSLSKGNNLKVQATSLDNVFFTLIQKKTKLASYLEGPAASSDPSAIYKLVAKKSELDLTPSDWKATHVDDVPLFRIANLAFSREEGLELPLFTSRSDALTSYKRLQESKIAQGLPADQSPDNSPIVQTTSILDLVQLFSTGGFEGRALEIYPTIESIEAAREIMSR